MEREAGLDLQELPRVRKIDKIYEEMFVRVFIQRK
jgi:hypothetical protein